MTLRMSHAFPSCYIATHLMFEQDAAAQARVPTVAAPAPISWFDDYQLHMTVCYLGWLPRATALAVSERLGKCPVEHPERVRLTGELSVVGEPLTQSLIAPIEPTEELIGLRQAVEGVIENAKRAMPAMPADGAAGALPPFRPHVTLGRVSPAAADTSGWSISPLEAAVSHVQLREGRVTWTIPE